MGPNDLCTQVAVLICTCASRIDLLDPATHPTHPHVDFANLSERFLNHSCEYYEAILPLDFEPSCADKFLL